MKPSSLIFGILIGALCACGLFAYLGQSESGHSLGTAGKPREIKIAHTLPVDHPVHLGIENFSKRLNELSGGKMVCQIFPNGQLGKETAYLEKLQTGSLDIAKTSAAPIASFVPRMKVFSFPYLFRDRAHYWSVLDGSVGRDLLDKLSDRGNGKPSGFRGLCYYDAGSRNFYTVDPVKVPADLQGKVIRVMQDPVAISMMENFGATPKPMASTEIYGALQRGNINGAENNPPTFVAQQHYEVCKNFTMDHHSRIPDVLSISSSLWQRLSEQEQNWVLTAARESSVFQRRLWQQRSDEAVEVMVKEGVTIHRPDAQLFRDVAVGSAKGDASQEVEAIKQSITNHK